MKYIPYLFSFDGELNALQSQDYSNNIMPLINIVKDKKTSKSSKSILDDIETIITQKTSNTFFINIPMNLELSKKKLKNPIDAFFHDIASNSNYQISILQRFSQFSNVIPVIDTNIANYSTGDLQKIRSKINSEKVAYIIYGKKLTSAIVSELQALITNNDFLIYNLQSYNLFMSSIKNEINVINNLKNTVGFKTISIKQIYSDLSFYKLSNSEIVPSSTAYDCIDSDFIQDFSQFNFDYFGDYCSIRNTPIYSGGQSYPSFIGLHPNKNSHFGFIGTAKDIKSFSTALLPNIIQSNYWNSILSSNHKLNCHGCSKLNSFLGLNIQRNQSNPINNATTWKTISICHYISIMDYKINNNLI